jgi:hypothetical protein
VLCPGLVDTKIYVSERNRPSRFSDAGPAPAGWSAEAAEQAFKLGLSPRVVGGLVLQAIRDKQFYIVTDPRYLEHVTHRAAQIVEGENPTMLPPPG